MNTTAPARRWLESLLPPGLVLYSLLLQLNYLRQYSQQIAFFSHPTGDSLIYLNLARQIISGSVPDVFYRAPAYPFLLALLLCLGGQNLLWVYLFQILLNCIVLVLVWQMARRAGGQLAGIAAGLLIGSCGPLWFYATKIGTATVVTTLLTGFMLLCSSAGRWRVLLAGLLGGLAALFWPGSIIIALSAGALGILLRRLRWSQLGLMIVGCALVILPLTIRNILRHGEPMPVSANAGFTFYQGNNRLAMGTLAQPPEVYELTRAGKILSSIADQETFDSLYVATRLGRDVKRSTASWFWTRQTLNWILHNPQSYILLLARKLMLTLVNYDSATEYDLSMEAELVPTMRLNLIGFGLLLLLAVFGAILLPDRGFWPQYGMVLGTVLALLTFYVSGRYRLTTLPALAVLAGIGVAELTRAIRTPESRNRRRLMLGTALAGGLFLLNLSFGIHLRRGSELLKANAYRNLGEVLIAKGDYQAAVRILKRSLKLQEQYADSASRQEMIDLAYTRRLLDVVNVAVNPAHRLLESAQAALGRADTGSALQHTLAAIEQDSNLREAYLLAGSIYGWQGKHELALRIFSRAVWRFPDDPVIICNQGVAALKTGWPFLIVLAFLVFGLLYMRWSGGEVGIYSALLCLVLSFINRSTRLTRSTIGPTIGTIGNMIVQTVSVLLPSAFIIAGLQMTGTLGNLVAQIVALSGASSFLILAVAAVVCFVFGMVGISLIAYLILAATMAPALA
ncbi:MAG: TRAP transporter large permease subunit, partial [candidate division WOR-3 bacterium]